ncbi:hypothetical protein ALC53_07464 [Atta colombica]|uniref:Uncharacterized protein n=1 Tax=Atta colombica TaxID=520822 RepID=A0A195BCW8_9HYME|nr:hypothetical protein ALC53_07464 [Atta colombica]
MARSVYSFAAFTLPHGSSTIAVCSDGRLSDCTVQSDSARGILRGDPASCLWVLYLHGVQRDRVLSHESRDEAQKETARDVLTRVFVIELMAGSEDYGKHYSSGKATRQEIMVSRSLRSTRGRIILWRKEKARSVWFIGDYGRDIGTYAFCFTQRIYTRYADSAAPVRRREPTTSRIMRVSHARLFIYQSDSHVSETIKQFSACDFHVFLFLSAHLTVD